MRISDWSSDVCSSDLILIAGEAALDGLQRHDDDVVLVVAEAALAARGKHADHLACRVPDAKPLADRIGPAKQVLHDRVADDADGLARLRSEEHTSELQSLMRISYAVFCLKQKTAQH